MIYSKTTPGARLGNILFQVAAGASLAHRNGDGFQLIAPGDKFEYVRQFNSNILRNVEILPDAPADAAIYKEPGFSFSEIPYSPSLCIEGYFQSEKYFDKAFVRNLFAITPEIESSLRKKFPALQTPGVCSISVRRGDYFKYPAHHPVYGKRFYTDAIAMLPADTTFIVCSDDIEWCKHTFKGDRFVFAENTPAVDQLYLQSLCAHNITSNTSFGWWGAWLNRNPDKMVICPTPWFGIMYRHVDTSDLIPEGWIRLDGHPVLRSRIGALRAFGYYKALKTWKRFRKLFS